MLKENEKIIAIEKCPHCHADLVLIRTVTIKKINDEMKTIKKTHHFKEVKRRE